MLRASQLVVDRDILSFFEFTEELIAASGSEYLCLREEHPPLLKGSGVVGGEGGGGGFRFTNIVGAANEK